MANISRRLNKELYDIQNDPPLNNNEDIKKAVDLMANKMTNDSKQKKNAKKQISKLVDKMKDINL